MITNRAGETGDLPPRSSRIFNMDSFWYFSTREGADIGPFDSRDQAANGLSDFLAFLELASSDTLRSFLSSIKSEQKNHIII